ncbi:MAG: tRNA glutamyl-Q(34) synthetase GluQRS, partial [Desulfovibrio sp.]|nr:tRNA glutamyl-Q(34) synthetase GluQRS [Desulfovibrio sp.]
AHIPLLLDNNGERLAKRHQSLALCSLRQQGVDARRIVGLLSRMAGINPREQPVKPGDLLPRFTLARLPKHDQRVTGDDVRRLAA